MIAMINFTGLIITTIFAAAAAVACNWLMLRVAFCLMQPAAVRRTSANAAAKRSTVRTELVRGTAELVRAFAPSRRPI